MARQAKAKIELITTLPSDAVARDRLKGSVNEIVDLQRQIADLKGQIKDIRDVEKSTYHIAPKFLNALAKREYDVRFEAEKKSAALDAEQETFTEADILFGRGKPANVAQTEPDDGEEGDSAEGAE
ncbi:hypothetical protein Hena1_00700 [Erwinia phage Hena1]|uniref:Uncharacterized protein n=1 Tax=Erwinia phage Hena1 TaxID=2678601 RepID=A0A6B9JB61_9CAUD|nr:hypothetical protein HWC84_gp069 [Erwinia phage Hena1]QGZ16246.1 hypothetical protein Hena1_00700 [Erwinia phage Hena1]